MIFKPLQYDSGKMKELQTGASKTIKKGDPLKFTSGLAEKAGAADETVRFISLQGVSGTSANDPLLALYVGGVEFEATTRANTDQDQVDSVFNLHADGTVENTKSGSYTDGDAFLVTEIVGVATDKKVRGYFLDRVSEKNAD